MRPSVQVIKRTTLPGTIDGHKPIVVVYRISGPHGWFRLVHISANLGRGYAPGEFKRNVLAILDETEEKQYVVIGFQEIDEADPSPEHRILREEMEPGTTLVQWWTREPIAVSPGVKVTHQRKTMTMDQGSAIGGPKGTGPRRFIVYCIIEIEGVRIGVANQHPHRYTLRYNSGRVARALRRGERVTAFVIGALARVTDMVIDSADFNCLSYPMYRPYTHPKQRVAFQRGLDYLRYLIA